MIKLDKLFPPNQVTPPTPDSYPNGAFKNETKPNESGDGTPIIADWLNDWLGFDGALMKESAMVADGNPDTASASQRLDALKKIIQSNVNSLQIFKPKVQADVEVISILTGTSILYIDMSDATENLIVKSFKGNVIGQTFSILVQVSKASPFPFSLQLRTWPGSQTPSATTPITSDGVISPYFDVYVLYYSAVRVVFNSLTTVFTDAQSQIWHKLTNTKAICTAKYNGTSLARVDGSIVPFSITWADQSKSIYKLNGPPAGGKLNPASWNVSITPVTGAGAPAIFTGFLDNGSTFSNFSFYNPGSSVARPSFFWITVIHYYQ